MALPLHGQAHSTAFPKVSDKVKMFERMSPHGAVTNDLKSIGSAEGSTTPTTTCSPLSSAADSAIDWEVFEMLSPAASPSAPPAFPDFGVMEDLEEADAEWAVLQLLGGGRSDYFALSESQELSKTGGLWDVVDWQVFEMLGGGGPEMFTTIENPEPSKTGWRWDVVDWQTFEMLGGGGPDIVTTIEPSKPGCDWNVIDWEVFQMLGAAASSYSCSKLEAPSWAADKIDWEIFQMLGGGGQTITTTDCFSFKPSKTGWNWDEIDWEVFAMLSCPKGWDWDDIDWDVFRALGSSTSKKRDWDWGDIEWKIFEMLGPLGSGFGIMRGSCQETCSSRIPRNARTLRRVQRAGRRLEQRRCRHEPPAAAAVWTPTVPPSHAVVKASLLATTTPLRAPTIRSSFRPHAQIQQPGGRSGQNRGAKQQF